MNTERLNHVNIALIIASAILACRVPFETFVMAYMVLGPAHYLTELPWLRSKNYYFGKSSGFDGNWLWLIAGLVTLNALVLKWAPYEFFTSAVFVAFGSALVSRTRASGLIRIAVIALLVSCSAFVTSFALTGAFFGVFLTTLVHVFYFTCAFMLLGHLKDRSWTSLVAVVLFGICGILILFLPLGAEDYRVSQYTADNVNYFGSLEKSLCQLLGWQIDWEHRVAAMRFIAFAYTYHYFNWFSKISVIKWHQVEASTIVVIVAAYVGCLAFYAIDYRLGLQALLFLSIAHVFLEFPLNSMCFGAIARELFERRQNSAAEPATLLIHR